jgi:branched-chain amino acid transport system permease protein
LEKEFMKKTYYYAAILILLGISIVIPFTMNRYIVRVLTGIFMFAALSESWDIITGKTGYFSFGHGVFFGLGAYAAALFMLRLHVPFWVGFITGGVAAALLAFLVGLPILRLKGHYFAIITLGIAEVIKGLTLNLESLTGGGVGLTLPLKRGSMDEIYHFFYFMMFFLMVATIITSYLVDRSRFGHGLVAIREDETSAMVLGVNATLYKMLAYALSAVFCGFVGATYAYWITYIEPFDVFGLKFSISIIVMALIGGIGTVWGPIIGAFVFEVFSELLWSKFLTFHSASLGLLMILIVFLLPKGFMEMIQSRRPLTLSGIVANLRRYME